MRNHIASLFVLFLGTAAAGCGEVEDSSCPGEQSDNVACTLDVCNAEGGGWAHIPNNNLCEAGQACSPTAGCVAGGALTGTATLLGKTDHSGITVTVDGLEGATAMTDATGAWSILVPPGSYTVSYAKEKYVTIASDEIIVLAEAAERAPDVVLSHGEWLGDDRTIISNYSVTWNPNRAFLIEAVGTAFGATYYATPADGSKDPVAIATTPNDIRYTNTHAVWTTSNAAGYALWSRPLTGASEPTQLALVPAGTNLYLQGTPGQYVVYQTDRYNGSYTEQSLWVAKTDGTANAIAPVHYTPDGNHYLSFVVNNETHAVFGTANYSSYPPNDGVQGLYRVDLSTGTVASLNVGVHNDVQLRTISPDRSTIMGTGYTYNGSQEIYRGFIVAVSGTANATLAPDYGGTSYVKFSDYAQNVTWVDGSPVYSTPAYPNGAGGTLGGELKVWIAGQATPTVIAGLNAYTGQFVIGKSVVYRDPATRILRAASVHSTSISTFVIDGSGNNTSLPGTWRSTTSSTSTSAYLVWTQMTGPSTNVPSKVMAATIPIPMTAAPNVVQLGSNLTATCGLDGVLSGTTFYQLCTSTGALQSFSQGSSLPAGSTGGVSGQLLALGANNRVAYRKTDGNVYTATGTFGGDEKLLADKIDPAANIFLPGLAAGATSPWVLYRDAQSLLTRISKVDGSVIDEPLFGCDATFNSGAHLNEGATHLFAGSARCATNDFRLLHAPATNLP